MPFINLPPTVSEMFWDLDRRIRALETAFRFNMPNVNFDTNEPTNPNTGDLFYNTANGEVSYWDGTQWVILSSGGSLATATIPNAVFKTVNNNLTYSGANPVTVYRQIVGTTILLQIDINFATITNFGTGQFQIVMPSTFPPAAVQATQFGTMAFNGNYFSCASTIAAGSRTFNLWYPTNNAQMSAMTHQQPTNLNAFAGTIIIEGFILQ